MIAVSIVLIVMLVLLLMSSKNCEQWNQNLSSTSPTGCYDSLTACSSGCTGWRANPGKTDCVAGPSCDVSDADCYGTQEGCVGNKIKGYRCSDSCVAGAVCGSNPADNWNNCHGSAQNCLDDCPGYRYVNNQCTAGAKCSGEANCFPTLEACRNAPSSISYSSLGSRCFNSGYGCGTLIGVGSPVKCSKVNLPLPTGDNTSGLRVLTKDDTLTVYGTVVSIDTTANTAKVMPDVIQSMGPSTLNLPEGTYYWGRTTWFTKKQDAAYLARFFGTYATSLSSSTLPNDPQLAWLASVPLSDLTLSVIPDVLL